MRRVRILQWLRATPQGQHLAAAPVHSKASPFDHHSVGYIMADLGRHLGRSTKQPLACITAVLVRQAYRTFVTERDDAVGLPARRSGGAGRRGPSAGHGHDDDLGMRWSCGFQPGPCTLVTRLAAGPARHRHIPAWVRSRPSQPGRCSGRCAGPEGRPAARARVLVSMLARS
jgi:hypothetical protein